MKIVLVIGGSYKSFYLNCFTKLRRCDLLVFNFNILYNYHLNKNNNILFNELSSLHRTLNCVIVAGINIVAKNVTYKSIIVVMNNKIKLFNLKTGVKIFVKNKLIWFGSAYNKYGAGNKIILGKNRIVPKVSHCSKHNFYVFMHQFGAFIVQNKKIQRKFNKHFKIILK